MSKKFAVLLNDTITLKAILAAHFHMDAAEEVVTALWLNSRSNAQAAGTTGIGALRADMYSSFAALISSESPVSFARSRNIFALSMRE